MIAVAHLSGIDRYEPTLFSVHMAQHLLLMMGAAPLLAFSAPVTQLLRASSPGVRRGWRLPVLPSGPIDARGSRVVAGRTGAVVAWGRPVPRPVTLRPPGRGPHAPGPWGG